MTIDQAAASLRDRLGEPDVFQVAHDGSLLLVRVAFVYRRDEVPKTHEGFEVRIARVSCW